MNLARRPGGRIWLRLVVAARSGPREGRDGEVEVGGCGSGQMRVSCGRRTRYPIGERGWWIGGLGVGGSAGARVWWIGRARVHTQLRMGISLRLIGGSGRCRWTPTDRSVGKKVLRYDWLPGCAFLLFSFYNLFQLLLEIKD
jgi:hypothetical protein